MAAPTRSGIKKLADVRPQTLGQASRISPCKPGAISLLLVHLKKRNAGSRPWQRALTRMGRTTAVNLDRGCRPTVSISRALSNREQLLAYLRLLHQVNKGLQSDAVRDRIEIGQPGIARNSLSYPSVTFSGRSLAGTQMGLIAGQVAAG